MRFGTFLAAFDRGTGLGLVLARLALRQLGRETAAGAGNG